MHRASQTDEYWVSLDSLEGHFVGEHDNEPKHLAWGVGLCCVIAGGAFYFYDLLERRRSAPFVDMVTVAIVLGLVVGNLVPLSRRWHTGIEFTAKRLQPVGVALLGARLDFMQVIHTGALSLSFSVGVVILTLVLMWWIGRLMDLPTPLVWLLGIGTAICGGSAIVAAAPIVRAAKQHVTSAVASVTLIGLMLMFILPGASLLLGFTQKQFGVLAGLSIHQMPQVIAAGFSYGSDAGQVATVVKMARICLLAPALIFLGWRCQAGQKSTTSRRARFPIPWFVLVFVALALLKSFGGLPTMFIGWNEMHSALRVPVATSLVTISTTLLVLSMVAVGIDTKFSALRLAGIKPFAAALGLSVVISGLLMAIIAFTI